MITPLPRNPGAEAFDALHDSPQDWIAAIRQVAARYTVQPVQPASGGTVLVGLADDVVVKLYPPFLRDHFDFEAAVLPRLDGRLSVPTPSLIDRFEHEGWPGLAMTRLQGQGLTDVWPALDEDAKCDTLAALGRLAAEVHAMPPDGVERLAPPWPEFIARQQAGCLARHTRGRLPPQLLAQVQAFVQGELPTGSPVILTGEYTPMNLLYDGGLTGMYDFGDGLVGPAAYDWLGPLCFLAAGHGRRCDAFLTAYGAPAGRDWRLPLLRLLLLHRYSNPVGQIGMTGWQSARTFEEVAGIIWPL
ncbi:MAG: aminoglycoside 3'-phosphotransferase/choline kinase family protein [Burkholderiales bacterium]|nr:aminoglycoside 3'-phosphotransferase/choline kinase family protein [Burkholderiales bacterium]